MSAIFEALWVTMWWRAKGHPLDQYSVCCHRFAVRSDGEKRACKQRNPVCVSETSPDQNQLRWFWLRNGSVLLGRTETFYTKVLFSGVFTFVVICTLLSWSCKCFSAPTKTFFLVRNAPPGRTVGHALKGYFGIQVFPLRGRHISPLVCY